MQQPATAAEYLVSTEAELRDTIADLSDGTISDSNPVIVLQNDIAVSTTPLPTVTIPLTIDTGAFTLAGTGGAGIAGPGGNALDLGGSVTIVGAVTGGAAAAANSRGAGGIGIVHNGGTITNNGHITGGKGGNTHYGAAAGRTPGVGGAGLSATGSTVVNTAAGVIEGGAGGDYDARNVATPGSNASLSTGGAGLVIDGGSLANQGTIRGGAGSAGSNMPGSADNIFARAGGTGAIIHGGTHTNSGTIVGGAAGVGMNQGATAHGTGGMGVSLDGGAYLHNTGSITGADGRLGGGTQLFAGSGGGTGAVLANSTLENEGTINGGNGAASSSGAGAVAVAMSGGGRLINGGTVNAGLGGTGSRNNAITLNGGGNAVELRAGFAINGNVIATATDTLALGGATDGVFNVSQIGAAAQYRGFGIYEKTGSSTWTLNGTTTAVTPWTLLDGTLSVSAEANLGGVGGALTFNGGVLQVTGTTFTSTARTINWGANGGGFDIANDANTFTVSQALSGGGPLAKLGAGTLVLTGDNSYAGGTTIAAGTLQLGDGGTSGSIVGDVVNDGVLAFNRSDVLTLNGAILGSGAVEQIGAGTTILTGDSSYTGGTTISAGVLQLGDGGASGSIVGDVTNDGVLAFNRSDALTFRGVISGGGAVEQIGSGTTILTGIQTYTGATRVEDGTLAAGAANAFSAASAYTVLGGGTLDLDGFDQTLASLENAGMVRLGGAPGTRLTVSGNYTSNGGALALDAALGTDGSPTDQLVIGGDSVMGSGATRVFVTNLGGAGAATTGDGIKIVDVTGASAADAFVLGAPAIGGVHRYELFQNPINAPIDGDWYLRAAGIAPTVPVYENYPIVMLGLAELPTLQQRVGDRYWPGSEGAATGYASPRNLWTRIEGAHRHVEGESTTGVSYDSNRFLLQAGIDGLLAESGAGMLIGGLNAQYGRIHADIASDTGSGENSTDSYGIGATLTWYGNDGFYVDGQASVARLSSDLSADDAGGLVDGNDGVGYAFSIEAGRKIAVGGSWSLTPQAQLAYTSVDFDAFTDPFGATVSLDSGDSLKGRIGMALNHDAGTGESRSHVYGIANLTYEFLDGTAVDVAGVNVAFEPDSFGAELGLGGTYHWAGGKYALYGEALASTSFEGSYGVKGTLGFSTKF